MILYLIERSERISELLEERPDLAPLCKRYVADDDDETEYLLVVDKDLKTVLNTLRLKVVGDTSHDDEGLMELEVEELEEDDEEGDIAVLSWHGDEDTQEAVEEMLESTLLPVLRKKDPTIRIVVHDHDGSPTQPHDQEGFHIHLASGVSGSPNAPVPDESWGHEYDGGEEMFHPSYSGFIIFDDGLFALAELIGERNFYIFPQLNDGEADAEVFSILIQKLAEYLDSSAEQRAEILRASQAERHARSRADYAKACDADFSAALTENREKMEKAQGRLDELTTKLVEQQRAVEQAEGEFRRLVERASTHQQRLEREFDDMLKIHGVKDAIVLPECIVVLTDCMYVEDPRDHQKREIGFMRFEIPLKGSDIRCFNLTRRGNNLGGSIGALHAPHVMGSARPCLGDMDKLIPQYLAEHRYATVVSLLLEHVQHFNWDNRHTPEQFLDGFPLVETTVSDGVASA